MNNNMKRLFFISTILFLLIGLTAISAAESSNDTATITTDTQVDDSVVSADNNYNEKSYDNNLNTKYSTDEKNIKKDTNTISISNDNVGDYFTVDDNEIFPNENLQSNSIIQFTEVINNVDYWHFNDTLTNITFTTNNLSLTNQAFVIDTSNFTFTNTSFIYNEDFGYEKAIIAYVDGFTIDNCYFNYDCNIISQELNTILLLNGDYATIVNSTFYCNIVSSGVNWDPTSTSDTKDLPNTVPLVLRGNYLNISDNVIVVTEKSVGDSLFPTFYGIYLNGHDVNFTRNNISLTGSNGYVYTVYIKSGRSNPNYNFIISENNIVGISQHNYTAGIYMDGSYYHDIIVINNNVTVISGTAEKQELNVLQDVVYAVVLTNFAYQGGTYKPGTGNVSHIQIINNTIVAEGHQVYGFEQFGGESTIVTGNNITVTGSRAQGLGIIGYNSTITGNNITAVGDTSLGESSPDYIPPITAGIQTLRSANATITNNYIETTQGRGLYIQDSNNTITSNYVIVHDYDYAVEFTNGANNTIENNKLITDYGEGSETIDDPNGNNYIGNNSDLPVYIKTLLIPDDITATLGDEVEIFIEIISDDGYEFNGEYIKVYANDEEIISEMIEEGLLFTYYTIPASWYKENITLTAKYLGNDQYAQSEANIGLQLSIPTSIQTQSDVINLKEGYDPVSIDATITDIMNNTVDADINVYIDDQLQSDINSYKFNPTTEGLYTLKLVFDGGLADDGYTYIGSEKEITINVTQAINDYFLKVDTTEFTIGDNATIQAGIYYGDDTKYALVENITKGKVVFKVNGKTLKDSNNKVIYAKIVNGTATIENYYIPESWDKNNITIEAVYSGSTQCNSLRSNKEQMTITSSKLTITTSDIQASKTGTINLTATINYNNIISQAKIVFKINGKTVKDANGKVIYAKVINNKVNLEYTLPDSYETGNYTLTATLISSAYDRVEDSKTLTII